MSTRSVIPFGPQHPVLPEPIHLDLVMEDEKVVEAIPSIGFIHRGLEKLVDKKDFTPKGILLFLAAGVLILSCVFTPRFQMSDGVNEGEYYSLAGIGIVVLAILCITFFAQNIRHAKSDMKLAHTKKETAAAQPAFTKKQIVKSIIFFILGGAGIVIGAQALVESGSELALRFGIEQRVISVVAFALGTSLPELITAISALRKKESATSQYAGAIAVGVNISNNDSSLTTTGSIIAGGTVTVTADAPHQCQEIFFLTGGFGADEYVFSLTEQEIQIEIGEKDHE